MIGVTPISPKIPRLGKQSVSRLVSPRQDYPQGRVRAATDQFIRSELQPTYAIM